MVGLPGISLVSCVPNESREDWKQVDSVGVVIFESNGFIAWMIHAVGDEVRGRLQQEGKV
jgi:hypothetical protein